MNAYLALIGWGIAVGVAVSAPLGPINFLCIRNTLRRGFAAGVCTGIGSILGDGVFAAAAAFGLKVIAGFVDAYEPWLQLAGGLFLLVLGARALLAEASREGQFDGRAAASGGTDAGQAPDGTPGDLRTIATTLTLTLTNPFTFAGFISLFGGAPRIVRHADGGLGGVLLVVAVMAGSLLWWLFLSWTVARLRERLDAHHVTLIGRLSGAAVLAFGLAVLGRVVWGFA